MQNPPSLTAARIRLQLQNLGQQLAVVKGCRRHPIRSYLDGAVIAAVSRGVLSHS